MPRIYLLWMRRSTALIFMLALTPTYPAQADWVANLVYLWEYGDLPQNREPPYWQPQQVGQQPNPMWQQQQQRSPREAVGIPLNPLTRPGYSYLIDLGQGIDNNGWFRYPFPSATGFGVQMAAGRYQMQADWDAELSILLDVNDSGQIVWLSFYFYPYFAYQ